MRIETLTSGRYTIPEQEDTVSSTVIKKNFNLKSSLTLKLIVLISVWSLFSLYFTQYIGISLQSEQWIKIFALDSQHPTRYWTYITSILSHGSIFHLFINMFVFLSFGRFAELEFSKKEYIGFLLFTGILAGLSQTVVAYLFIPDGMKMVGFSGALSGIIGYISVRANVPVLLFFVIRTRIRTAVLLFIAGSLSIMFVYGLGAYKIAHTAHLSGLFAGILYGVYKDRTIEDRFSSRFLND